MKKHNVNNREGRGRGEKRERERVCTRYKGRQGRVESGEASRKTLGFARSGLVAAVARVRMEKGAGTK